MQADLIDYEANYDSARFPEPRPFQNIAHEAASRCVKGIAVN